MLIQELAAHPKLPQRHRLHPGPQCLSLSHALVHVQVPSPRDQLKMAVMHGSSLSALQQQQHFTYKQAVHCSLAWRPTALCAQMKGSQQDLSHLRTRSPTAAAVSISVGAQTCVDELLHQQASHWSAQQLENQFRGARNAIPCRRM